MARKAIFSALVWLLLAAIPACAGAVSLQQVGGFFRGAIFVTSAPGSAERLLVTDRNGRVILFEGGVATTLANFEGKVSCCDGERGLFSAIPAPDFASSGRLYVDYSGVEKPGEIHIAELVVTEPGGPFTLNELLVIPHPNQTNHYGGQLQFGPEGDLYISTGDGGGSNDVEGNSQDLESLLGKLLRVEPDPAAPNHYKVPADNPSFGVAPHKPEIWSLGLRNPFHFSFDRLSGAMLIGDVGQNAREEIDYAPAPLGGKGANYGWNCREGLIKGPATDPECATATGLLDPIFDYPHLDPGGGRAHGCAIIGGYVSRDPLVPELLGRYVYSDFCTGEIRSLDLANPFASDRSEGIEVPTTIESFGEDAAGRLYAVAAGSVYRLLSSQLAVKIKPHLGIRSRDRRVKRRGRATIVAFVSPCVRDKASSAVVTLLRGRKKLERRHLNRVCTVSFRPRVTRRTHFRVKLAENETYLPAESRALTIRLRRHHR